ncbi:52 kDa repressor of the inhibitor of the protein kinase-like [Oopsacas minuta]|uniref:52 kDa repressor of the inhibitor of the protein kinase-like n=1 Tax=Oopsacas minuta TaxID=111878 RepID=A0AAV7JIM5_9METZ|nr:52 kDa repressor of the inhibitor of the protein kinase-like [Oopsacas minuta]
MTIQLKELVINDAIKAFYPNLSKLGEICPTLPVSTASMERSFSQLKQIKTRVRSQLSLDSLSDHMKIAIESLNELTETDLEKSLTFRTVNQDVLLFR